MNVYLNLDLRTRSPFLFRRGPLVISPRQRPLGNLSRNLVARAFQEDPPLKRWQEQQLRQALIKGRKNVEVSKLCQQTQLDRRRVLAWLKNPPEEEKAQWSEEMRDSPDIRSYQPWAPPQSQRTVAERAETSSRPSFESRRPYQQDPARDFRASRMDRKFNKAVLSTLEMVFESTQIPSEEVIYSIVDLHHVPKRQVVDWFVEKRRILRNKGSKGPGRYNNGR